MTNKELKKYSELKKKFKEDADLKDFIDLYTLQKMNEVSVANSECKNPEGILKEIIGVSAFRVEIFTDEGDEE